MKKIPFISIGSAALSLAAFCLLGLTACSPQAATNTEANNNVKPINLDAMVHPDLRAGLAGMDKSCVPDPENIHHDTIPDESTLPKSEMTEVFNRIIPADGNPNLRVRVYKPKDTTRGYPAVMWIHGGGHIYGAPEFDEAFNLRMVEEIGCIVVSPDYRLAPENPYPADVDDCFATLKWLANKEVNGLPVDTERIAVGGVSAGGGLAIATALKARDAGGPKLCFMLPIYPMLDYRNNTISARQITDTRVWCHEANAVSWKMYLGDLQNVPAYASPAMATDVSGLPPANIVVGTLDPFRDEDIEFAQRMMDAGIPVELHVVPGAFHAFDMFGTPLSEETLCGHITALKNALLRH